IVPQGEIGNYVGTTDKVGTRVVALKNVTFNEPVFQGHFPEFSIFPGVMLVEAMAQASSFSLYPHLEDDLEGKVKDLQCILVGVDGARFRRPVVPGDTLKIEEVTTKARGKLYGFHGEITVDGQKAAEADILANLQLREEVMK